MTLTLPTTLPSSLISLPRPFLILIPFLPLILYFIYRRTKDPLRKVPPFAPLAGDTYLPQLITQHVLKREVRSLYAAHKRHGPVVRLSPTEVSVCSLSAQRNVYGAGFPRTTWFLQFANFNGTKNLVSLLNVKDHSARRRLVSGVYAKSALVASRDFALGCKEVIWGRMLPSLRKGDGGRGRNVRGMDGGEGVADVLGLGSAAGAECMLAYAAGLQNTFDYTRPGRELAREDYLRSCRLKMRGGRGRDRAVKKLEDELREKVSAAEQWLSKRTSGSLDNSPSALETYPVLTAQLLKLLPEREGPRPLQETLTIISSEVLDNIEASREGIGLGLTYSLWELSKRPELQAALRKSLAEEQHAVQPATTGAAAVDAASLRALDANPLLDAILVETLRLYHPGPGPQRRVVPAEGVTLDGVFLPGGTTVSSSAYCLHRHPGAFPRAGEWRVERWLVGWGADEDEKEKEREKDRVARAADMLEGLAGVLGDYEQVVGTEDPRRWWWAFGNGGRMCVGNHLAMLVMKLMIAAISLNFRVEIVDDNGMEQRDEMMATPVGDKLVLKFIPIKS